MAANYNAVNNTSNQPYGAGDPYYAQSTGFIAPPSAAKKRTSNWFKIGVPVLIVVIVAAVLGGVLGSRASNNNSSSSNANSGSANGGSNNGSGGNNTPGSSIDLSDNRFATATDSRHLQPLYPSTTAAAFSTPTFSASSNLAWPEDPFKPANPNPNPTDVRSDRPRLFAPQYKWDGLAQRVAADPYLSDWNATIFQNATDYYNKPPVAYFLDGPSGILDIAREVKMRIKAFAYVYRITRDTRWVDRIWSEIQNAAGNGPASFGDDENDRWHNEHFLDTAEFTAAFGIAYDWLYDVLTNEQKTIIRDTMIRYGLQPGLSVFTGDTTFGWWAGDITGNWNCVCNGGLTVGALAILGDDTTGVASQLLAHTIDNAKAHCVNAVRDDGSWAETPHYWYFGVSGHAEMVSALLTATGSHHGVLDANSNYWQTGLYHMYVNGPGSLFDYGDHGPNKFSSTANAMFLYGDLFQQPTFVLHQRDQHDAAEPWSMFWYNPSVSGAFWDGLALDHFFDNENEQWASMRSSWTDHDALFVAIRAGRNDNHQTHNDLDVGDFVIDAMGERWAGEFGSANYNSPGYFNSGAQDADRWKYYRKMTEGQNTILIGRANQRVDAAPSIKHDSSGTTQGSSTVFQVPNDSTAFFTADMSSAYNNAQTVKRGIRLLNGRRQVLVRDEINASQSVDWLMHTNATVVPDGTSATLTLNGKEMRVSMLNPPAGASFSRQDAVRFPTDVTPPETDQENPDVSVLMISLPAGQYTLEVLFNPQWPGMSADDFVTPSSVALDNWSLRSHD